MKIEKYIDLNEGSYRTYGDRVWNNRINPVYSFACLRELFCQYPYVSKLHGSCKLQFEGYNQGSNKFDLARVSNGTFHPSPECFIPENYTHQKKESNKPKLDRRSTTQALLEENGRREKGSNDCKKHGIEYEPWNDKCSKL